MASLSEVNRQYLTEHVKRLNVRRKVLEVRIHFDSDKWHIADRIDRAHEIQAVALRLLGMPLADPATKPGTELLNRLLAGD